MSALPGWGLPRYPLVWKCGTCHARLPLGHSSLGKARPPGCRAAQSEEMCSAAAPAEKCFQGKVFKTRAAGERGGNRGESEIRRFSAYVGFKEWRTPAEALGTASQAAEDIGRWVHYRGIFISNPRGQPLAVLLVGAWEGTLCSQPGEGMRTHGEVLACGTKKATGSDRTTQVHVRSCWSWSTPSSLPSA